MIRIDKNVPIPRQRAKYPFRSMGVGDSFFVALGPSDVVRVAQTRLTNSAQNALGAGCYTVRQVVENGVKGVRVWRLK